jgi:hypothetical protein
MSAVSLVVENIVHMDSRQTLRRSQQLPIRVLVFIAVSLLSSLGQGPSLRPAGKSALVVQLSAKKSTIHPGGLLTLRVTIKNDGPEDLFIDRDISVADQRFILYIQHGSKREGPLVVVSSESLLDRTTPFASLLSRNFTVLGAGKFYGGEAVMDPKEYPQLLVPGRYLVRGEYSSRGFHEPGEGNPLMGREEEINKLPFKAWEGRVESNAIWIEVSKAAK